MDADAEPTASTSASTSPRAVVQAGVTLMVGLPTRQSHKVIVPANCTRETTTLVHLPKVGAVQLGQLIGKRYGLGYNVLADATLEEMDKDVVVAPEATDATNESIINSHSVQALSMDDIEAMRASGMSGEEIIARQIGSHAQFELKNEFSKSKYIARKEAKFLKFIRLIAPTRYEVANHLFYSTQATAKNVFPRPDTLGQMLTLANVRPDPSCRALVAEDGSGLIAGSILAAMGGKGSMLLLHDHDSPPALPHLPLFQLTEAETAPYGWINWSVAQPDWVEPDFTLPEPEPGRKRPEKEVERMRKRKVDAEGRQATREQLFANDWQALIVATQYDPSSIVKEMLPRLAGSAQIVVFSELLQPLVQLSQHMAQSRDYLAPSLTEPTLRKYQVLPGRMHPEMNGLPASGFILSATRVIGDDEPAPARAGKRRRN